MKNTLILIVTHRGVSDETYESVIKTECPNVLKVKNQACIDRARSIGFDQALSAFRMADKMCDYKAHETLGIGVERLDTLLCIDDDMVFEPSHAQALVNESRRLGHPVSAMTVNSKQEYTHRPWPNQAGRFATGLAFMAIPRAELERVSKELPTCGPIRVWCLTGPHHLFPGEWIGEDYSFCSLFNGVELAPHIQVGHLKTMVLWAKDPEEGAE